MRVARVDIRLSYVELRLVGDVAHDAGLCPGAKQRALRAFEDLDALEVRNIDVEVAAGELSRLLVEIERHVREATDDAGCLRTGVGGREAPHDDVVLPGTAAGDVHIRQELERILEGGDVELRERFAGERLDRDRHILDAFRSPLGRDNDLFDSATGGAGLVARTRRGGGRCRGAGVCAQDRHDGR